MPSDRADAEKARIYISGTLGDLLGATGQRYGTADAKKAGKGRRLTTIAYRFEAMYRQQAAGLALTPGEWRSLFAAIDEHWSRTPMREPHELMLDIPAVLYKARTAAEQAADPDETAAYAALERRLTGLTPGDVAVIGEAFDRVDLGERAPDEVVAEFTA